MNELIPKSLGFQTPGRQIVNCPFPGLRPFRTDESYLFFGRNKLLRELLEKLLEKRLIVLTGNSGSGKTSILNAGLIPGFEKYKNLDDTGSSLSVSFCPGEFPVKSMVKALAEKINIKEKKNANEKAVEEMLFKSPSGLIEVVKAGLKPNESLLIVIDKFEEICRIENNEGTDSPDHFINLLIEAYNSQIPVYLAIGLRAEYTEKCSEKFGINQVINNNMWALPELTPDELRDIITLPVITSGGGIESQVVNQIISDSLNIRDKLPKIQYALKEIWNHCYKQNTNQKYINISDYNAVGSINSLPNAINLFFGKLPQEEKKFCEKILKSITAKDNGIYTSIPLKISDIEEATNIPLEIIIEIADKLRMPDCPVLLPSSEVILTSGAELQLSHDCLPYLWNNLASWIDEEAASILNYKTLAKEAEIFQASRSELLRPPALFKFLEWEKMQQPTVGWAKRHNPAFERTMLYLRRSEQEYNKEEEKKRKLLRLRKKRKVVLFVLLISILIVVLAGLAIKFSGLLNEADLNKDINKKINNSISSVKKINIAASYNANNDNTKQITKEQIKSDTARNAISDVSYEEAYIKKLLVKADSLAAISLQIKNDKYLKGLLAYYAFSFYNRFGETEYKDVIYRALADAVKILYGDYYNVFKGHTDAVNALIYFPRRNIFFSAASDGRVAEWKIDDKLKRPKLISSENTNMQAACMSNNGRWLVCASSKLPIQVFDMNDTDIEAEYFKGPSVNVLSLAFLPDNKHFFSAGNDKKIILWDIETGEYKMFADAGSQVTAICADSAGRSLVVGTEGGKILIYDIFDNEINTISEGNNDPITSIAVSKDGNYMVTGSNSGNIVLWNYLNRDLIAILKGHKGKITDLKFSHKCDIFISTGIDGKVLLWPLDSYSNGPVLIEEHDSPVLSVSFSYDGNNILIGSVNENRIVIIPVKPAYLATMICRKMIRNLSKQEWDSYIGNDVAYEKVCGR